MSLFNKFFTSSFITFIFISLSACSGVKVMQQVEMPAKQSGMQQSKKLAVFNLEGDADGTFSVRLESYLAGINVRGTPYFELLERKMIERIIKEQKMVSGSGMFNDRDAVKLGNLAGADTMIMGGINMPVPATHNYQRPEKLCMQYEIIEGKQSNKCTGWSTRFVTCTERTANIDFTFKAVSVQTGNIAFTHTYSGKAADNYCGYGGGKSTVDLQNDAIKQVFGQLRTDIAPYIVTMSLEFMEKDDFMTANTATKIEQAVAFIKQQRMSRACELFQEAAATDTNSPALYYDMGLCAELSADLDKAEILYTTAERKSPKPEELISTALNRIQEKKANLVTLSKQIR